MAPSKTIQEAIQLLERDPSKMLGLKVGSLADIKPGQYVPMADAQSTPKLSFAVPSPNSTYLVVGLDIDAPFPSFDLLSPTLHWIQSGFEAGSDRRSLTTTDPFVANFVGPAPPPRSAPHRYIFSLYEQPADFNVFEHVPPNGRSVGSMQRMRFDLDAWAKKVKLGGLVACNYYTSN